MTGMNTMLDEIFVFVPLWFAIWSKLILNANIWQELLVERHCPNPLYMGMLQKYMEVEENLWQNQTLVGRVQKVANSSVWTAELHKDLKIIHFFFSLSLGLKPTTLTPV